MVPWSTSVASVVGLLLILPLGMAAPPPEGPGPWALLHAAPSQGANLATAQRLLAITATDAPSAVRAALLAHEATHLHLSSLMPFYGPAPTGRMSASVGVAEPSFDVAWTTLLAANGMVAGPDTDAAAAFLKSQPDPLPQRFAAWFAAFVAFQDAARAVQEGLGGVAVEDAPLVWEAAAPRLAKVLVARLALFDASLALAAALEATPPRAGGVDLDDLLVVDLAGVDSVHERNVTLLLDVGGDDVYRNNGGGACADQRAAAAVLDLAGRDRYISGYSCGVNGGGFAGGAGFLLDLAGDDTYLAEAWGVNGGAGFLGTGLLVDAAGDDRYEAVHNGVNGGAALGAFGLLVDAAGHDTYLSYGIGSNGGGYNGAGALVDAAGDDRYAGVFDSVNGGGSFRLGRGFLFDGGGDDAYTHHHAGLTGGSGGFNGGAWALGTGFLLDASGDDRYTATAGGVNGGGITGEAQGGGGLLLDLRGRDTYDDDDGGRGIDRTVVPKGLVGAQVDVPG